MENYFNLGTSPYREEERKLLIKCLFSITPLYSCTIITLKEYKDSNNRKSTVSLYHFSLEEHRDYGDMPTLSYIIYSCGIFFIKCIVY